MAATALDTPLRLVNAAGEVGEVGDAGARLAVDGRLYGQMFDYSAAGLDEQWGRFWK